MKKFDARTLVLWIIVFLLVLFFIQTSKFPARSKIPYSEFKQLLKDGRITDLQGAEIDLFGHLAQRVEGADLPLVL